VGNTARLRALPLSWMKPWVSWIEEHLTKTSSYIAIKRYSVERMQIPARRTTRRSRHWVSRGLGRQAQATNYNGCTTICSPGDGHSNPRADRTLPSVQPADRCEMMWYIIVLRDLKGCVQPTFSSISLSHAVSRKHCSCSLAKYRQIRAFNTAIPSINSHLKT
jgi:hypothetical protein